MGFWSRWLGTPDRPEPPPGERPAPIVVARHAPSDLGEGLTLQPTFYDNPPVIEAHSGGLAALGQAELVMSVRLYEDDDPRAVLSEIGKFFRTVGHFARQGMLVSDGGYTEFGRTKPFHPNVGGILYAAEGERLRAIIVDQAEVAVAKRAGTYRILSRLGMQARHFPYPNNSDLRRPSVAQADEQSLIERVPTAAVAGLLAVLDGTVVRLVGQLGAQERLRELIAQMPDGAAVAWLTSPDRTASNRLYWHPGQQEPSAISDEHRSNQRICGWFLALVLGQQSDEIRLHEDGFLLLLTNSSWGRLRVALQAGEPFAIPPQEGRYGLLLSWGDGVDVYRPRDPDPARSDRHVMLITPQDVIAQTISAAVLSDYIERLFSALASVRDTLPDPAAQLMVRLELRPDDHPILMMRSVPAQDLPQALANALFAVGAPGVQENVAFQLMLDAAPPVH